jgi:hypothetical protein
MSAFWDPGEESYPHVVISINGQNGAAVELEVMLQEGSAVQMSHGQLLSSPSGTVVCATAENRGWERRCDSQKG